MVVREKRDLEVSAAADAAMKALVDLFSNLKGPCKNSGRKYVLELVDGRPVFCRYTDEMHSILDNFIAEVLAPNLDESADEIVPQKLEKAFLDPHRCEKKA